MISEGSKKALAEYEKQGYEAHTQFVARDKKVCLQVMAVKETKEGQLSCVLIEEVLVEDQSCLSMAKVALEVMGIHLSPCGKDLVQKEKEND